MQNLSLDRCVRVCVCVREPVLGHTEGRGQPWLSALAFHLVDSARLAGLAAASEGSPVSASPHRVSAGITGVDYFVRCKWVLETLTYMHTSYTGKIV